MTSIHPEVLWAQRSSKTDATRNYVYLTIAAPDVPEPLKLDLQPTKLSFKGTSATKKDTYELEFDFFEEIDPKESKINHTDRDIEMVLRKKELKEEFWPRLLKDKAKVHWLKTDFDKWVDEDEQDPNAEDDDYMSKMGGFGGGDAGFEGIDFSKFGSGPGGDAAAPAPESDDDDDDDMPELVDADKEQTGDSATKEAEKPKSVIEELE